MDLPYTCKIFGVRLQNTVNTVKYARKMTLCIFDKKLKYFKKLLTFET